MTPDTIAELERLEKLATAGPWESSGYTIRVQLRRQTVDGGYIEYRPYVANSIAGSLSGDERRANMALIAAARNALPSLIAAAKENERLREIVEWYVDPMNVRPEDEEMVRRALEGETPPQEGEK